MAMKIIGKFFPVKKKKKKYLPTLYTTYTHTAYYKQKFLRPSFKILSEIHTSD